MTSSMKLCVPPLPKEKVAVHPAPSHRGVQELAGGGLLSRPRARAFGDGGGRGRQPVGSLSWRKLRPTMTPLENWGKGGSLLHFIGPPGAKEKTKKQKTNPNPQTKRKEPQLLPSASSEESHFGKNLSKTKTKQRTK